MIRIKYLLPIFLMCLGAAKTSFAQNINSNTSQTALDYQGYVDDMKRTIKNNSDKFVYVKGSPYINDDFQGVKLKRFDNKTFLGRYDAYLGEMHIKLENDTIALNNSENFELTFLSNNKIYKTINYTNKEGASKRGFLVVLIETDSMAFLKEEIIKLHEEKKTTIGYDKGKPAEFIRAKDNYYYRIGHNVSVLAQNRKDFLQLFPEHSTKLKAFIKENKISLRKDEDLITLFKYLQTL